jgi:hypothetical protein
MNGWKLARIQVGSARAAERLLHGWVEKVPPFLFGNAEINKASGFQYARPDFKSGTVGNWQLTMHWSEDALH